MAIDGLCISNGRNTITKLVYGHNEIIAKWVATELKQPLNCYQNGMYHAVGVIKNDRIIGGIVWHNYHNAYNGEPLLIEVTIATIDKMWCSRHNLCELFGYPFIQLGVKRVQATCNKKSKHVRKTLERLGFKFEGIVRQGHPAGGDAAHYSILKNECKWLKNGKVNTIGSRSPESSGDIGSTNTIQ